MSISAQDLMDFHKKHLGEFHGTIKFDDAETDDFACTDDNAPESLGFYPDGVERTLTDEQIEFFRQSDIRKEELRVYKENLALQEAQAEAQANAQAQDPTSQQIQTEEVAKKEENEEAEAAGVPTGGSGQPEDV
ncbi:hypothetical protein CJU89_1731 [Yarrowia sp. B02]|nr:hypothetical protein CJU89_1731 [Yarrowia sp. B02]